MATSQLLVLCKSQSSYHPDMARFAITEDCRLSPKPRCRSIPLHWDHGCGPQSVNMPLPQQICLTRLWPSIERRPVNSTETAATFCSQRPLAFVLSFQSSFEEARGRSHRFHHDFWCLIMCGYLFSRHSLTRQDYSPRFMTYPAASSMKSTRTQHV